MAIVPVTPIVIPTKTLDKYWATRVVISALEVNGEANAQICLVPYNDLGEKSESDTFILNIDKIMEKTQDTDSNIAKAMYFLLLAIEDEYQAQQGE